MHCQVKMSAWTEQNTLVDVVWLQTVNNVTRFLVTSARQIVIDQAFEVAMMGAKQGDQMWKRSSRGRLSRQVSLSRKERASVLPFTLVTRTKSVEVGRGVKATAGATILYRGTLVLKCPSRYLPRYLGIYPVYTCNWR